MFARGSDDQLCNASPVLPVSEVVDLIRETFGCRFNVEFRAEAGLPFIALDPTQLHQVVMNLCVNARDAMPDGGRLEISLARCQVGEAEAAVAGLDAQPGDYITVAVRDHGTGIPAEIVPRLFDPFFTTKPVGKGTGLGLATVMRVLKRHGGFVSLETAVGVGTCFTCHFPVRTLPSAERAKVSTAFPVM
jgi:signal transduction histidine kinase